MRRLLLLTLAMLLLPLVVCDPAAAQSSAPSWPTRDIHVFVPQSAGSALDIVTRSVMEQVAVRLGQPAIIENCVGAGNTIAMAAVARAEPDGYTVLANSSTHSLVPVTYTTLPFDTFRDLSPIIPLGNTPLVMVASASRNYNNVADFVADAKAKHGAMNYASGGTGSLTHLAMEAFRLAAGFEAVHIPFKGAPEALTEVLAGRADVYFAPLPAALPFLKDGGLRALAVSGSNRAVGLPDVPTIGEAGYPEATYNFWVGLFLPAKTPPPIMERLYNETHAALQTALVRERLDRLATDPLPLDRAGFAKMIQDEFTLNTKVAKAAGVKAN